MPKKLSLTEFILENNIASDFVIFDSTLRRFSRKEKNGDECWIVCHEAVGIQTVIFGDWSQNIQKVWQSKTQRLSVEQHKEVAKVLSQYKEENEKIKKQKQDLAKVLALQILSFPHSAQTNGYCESKKISPKFGAKIVEYKNEKSLIVPILNKDLDVVNLQIINSEGKKFLYGGEINGCFHLMENDSGKEKKIFVCEGYATGFSLSQCLENLGFDYKIYCAMSANNIVKVIEQNLSKEKEIIICADNDRFKETNTGLSVALNCVKDFSNVKMFLPDFGDYQEGTDLNDLVRLIGINGAEKQLEISIGKPIPIKKPNFFSINKNGEAEPLYHEMAEYFKTNLHVVYNPSFWSYFDGKKYIKTDEGWVVKKINELCGQENKPHHLNQFKIQIQALCYEPIESFLSPPVGMINFQNGILDINTFELLPHDKKHFFFYCLNRNYVKGAKCPRWIEFLNKIMLDDQKTVDLIQEIFGYVLLGGRQYKEKVFLFIGTGENGKGTVTKILQSMIGAENTSNVRVEDFNKPFSAIRLKDKMVNISGELSKKMIDSDSFKTAAAGEYLTMAYKGKDEFDAPINARLIITCNAMPVFDEVTEAIDRRFIMINFKYRVKNGERNNKIFELLNEEIEGITQWAIDGLIRFKQTQNFTASDNSNQTLEEFRLTRDNVARFCKYYLTAETGTIAKLSDVYISYQNFCENEGTKSVSKIEMSRRIVAYFLRNSPGQDVHTDRIRIDGGRNSIIHNVKLTNCDVDRKSIF